MKQLHKDFESKVNIEHGFREDITYNEDFGLYETHFDDLQTNCEWMNGAWYMYQLIYDQEYNVGDKVKFIKNKEVDGELFPIEIGDTLTVESLHNDSSGKWLNCSGWALSYNQVVKV